MNHVPSVRPTAIELKSIRNRHPQNDILPVKKQKTQSDLLERLLEGKQYMDANFLNNPTIEEIAQKSCLSVYYFHRCFKHVFEISPYQYLLIKRLEYSYLLVVENKLTLSKIATICGFADQFAFSKSFKRRFGICPSKCV